MFVGRLGAVIFIRNIHGSWFGVYNVIADGTFNVVVACRVLAL